MSDDATFAPVERRVIGAFYRVYNALGVGFLESVYANALAVELSREEIPFEREARLVVRYRGVVVGTFRADFLVDGRLVLELKAGRALVPSDRAQLLNELRASELDVGLLLCFGPEPVVRRVVASTEQDSARERQNGEHGENCESNNCR